MDKINTPNVIGMFGSQTDDRTIFVIQPPAFLVALWKLEAFFAPYPLYLFVIDLPSFDTQKCCYLAVAITTILFSKPDQRQT